MGQPALHGEKYVRPSAPHTGSKMVEVQLQPRLQGEERMSALWEERVVFGELCVWSVCYEARRNAIVPVPDIFFIISHTRTHMHTRRYQWRYAQYYHKRVEEMAQMC